MADLKQSVNSQPKGTAPMLVGGNRNAKNCPIGPDGKRDWSFGLFDCFSECGLCCCAYWCKCVVHSKTRRRLDSLQNQGAPLSGGGDPQDVNCFLYGGLSANTLAMQIRTRTDIRERYGIRGNATGDCLTFCCCGPCALTQERREVELEEGSFY